MTRTNTVNETLTGDLTSDLFNLTLGEMSVENAKKVLFKAGLRCTSKQEASDLGFITYRGLGADLATDLNPFSRGPLAVAFDMGIVEGEIADNLLDEDQEPLRMEEQYVLPRCLTNEVPEEIARPARKLLDGAICVGGVSLCLAASLWWPV